MSWRSDMLEKCKSKLWFESETEALEFSRKQAERYSETRANQAYHCAFCRLYHLTSSKEVREQNKHIWRQELSWQETQRTRLKNSQK